MYVVYQPEDPLLVIAEFECHQKLVILDITA